MIELYVDMDGVLFDFAGASCRVHGQDPVTIDCWNYYEKWGLTEDEFWEPINAEGREFWANLEKLPWADELLGLVRELDPNFHILTKPSTKPDCMAGKLDALQRAFGEDFRRYIFAPNKYPLAAYGRLLIDDSDDNLVKWAAREGSIVVMPQPWNIAAPDCYRRMESVREQFEEYKKFAKKASLARQGPGLKSN